MSAQKILKTLPLTLLAALFLVSCGGGKSDSAKNKENKEKKEVKEEKDSSVPKRDTSGPEITAAKFANAVRKHILEEARKNEGILHLPDPRKDGDTLKVELKRVVEASVDKSAKDVRYVCAKFKGIDNGKDYDIDFFLEGDEPSSLKPARDPILHKVEGEARYKYVKEGDLKKPKKIDKDIKKEKNS